MRDLVFWVVVVPIVLHRNRVSILNMPSQTFHQDVGSTHGSLGNHCIC